MQKSTCSRAHELATMDMEAGMFDAAYRELSAVDRALLCAMLDAGDEARLADVARIMGKPNGYAATYKTRLLDQGVIEERPGGGLQVCISFFQDYLRKRRTAG